LDRGVTVPAVAPARRLLFLCQTLPYPPDGGVWIRTYHVLRLLARAFDITALCFERPPTPGRAHDAAAGCDALRNFARVESFPVPQHRSRIRYAWDHARSTALQQVYTTYMFESPAFERRLDEVLKTTPIDLVHIDSLDLAGYLPACRGIPVVCTHQNVESALLRRRAGLERKEWRRAYVRHQARLQEDAERYWCERVALNVTVSDRDGEVLGRIAPRARIVTVPNGVDLEEFRPSRRAGTGMAFVGGLDWLPNLDAIEFFARDILPHIRAAGMHVPVRCIGAATAAESRRYREAFGVEVTGYVDDVRPFIEEAACQIVPLRAGGGTRLKILNAWAMAKPVITTSIGCEGLAAVDGENALVRDDPRAFADAVVSVLSDAALARRLGERGRATVERLYGWDTIGRELIRIYLDRAAPANRNSESGLLSTNSKFHIPNSELLSGRSIQRS
jgi:glycosyltransferase involved in cell wall biosynthesis